MFVKGHKQSVGNKGGRRPTKAEEIAGAIENITSEALIKLANSKVYKHLNTELDFNKTKEMALPVALKGMTDKSTITLRQVKPLLDVLHNNGNQENSEPKGEN